jgi:hypothetical protein
VSPLPSAASLARVESVSEPPSRLDECLTKAMVAASR